MAKIGYILRKFPVLSETFILNEILELEAQGNDIHIFAMERPNDPRFHEDVSKLKAEITYLPDVTKFKSLWKARKRAAKSFKKGHGKAFRYVLRHPRRSIFFRFLQSCYIANHARKLGITHFHSHFANRPTTVSFLTSMITGIPYTFTAHAVDIFKTSLCSKALQKKMERAKNVVTVSDYNVKFLSEMDHKGNIIKINNGINFNKFEPKETPSNPIFTFICVARLVEKKGHPILLEACKILKDEGLKFQCMLVGAGRLKQTIEKRIKKLGLKEHVKLMGPQSHDQVLKLYHKSDAYILPCCVAPDGNRDGLPVSIVESLACGIPVITTPMTGNPEVVHHEENGLIIPFENVEETANAMRRLLTDNAFFQTLKKNARSSVLENFDIKETTTKLAGLFQ